VVLPLNYGEIVPVYGRIARKFITLVSVSVTLYHALTEAEGIRYHMASIIQMPNGRWRALVRRAGRKSICKTLRTKAAVERWARDIEAQLDAGEQPEQEAITVEALIQAYRRLRDASRPIADTSTAHYTLKTLEDILGGRDARRLTTEDLVAYCHKRRDAGAGPYTLNMDLSQLSTALRYAASAKSLVLPDAVGAARPLLKHLGLIGGGGKRERRPTRDELDRVVEYLGTHRGAVYADAVRFAVASAMRAGEICRLKWVDVDRERKLVIIRDRKDPRQKAGNDQTVPLLGDAWEVAAAQPAGDRIFPIEAPTLSKYFTEACRELAIPDLHLHDLRHEGTSQMFERGLDIPEVALVTGHKKWDSLRRYTQLKPEDLHR
jgi:integrase